MPYGTPPLLPRSTEMPKHNKSASDDDALRAFYEAFGLAPDIIEGAIKQRYEKPTNFTGWEKAGEAARIARERRRNSIKNAENKSRNE